MLQGCISCGLESRVFISAWCLVAGTRESSAQPTRNILGSFSQWRCADIQNPVALGQAPHTQTSGFLWVFWNQVFINFHKSKIALNWLQFMSFFQIVPYGDPQTISSKQAPDKQGSHWVGEGLCRITHCQTTYQTTYSLGAVGVCWA